MRPGSPLRLQPLPPSETTHAAPTTPLAPPNGRPPPAPGPEVAVGAISRRLSPNRQPSRFSALSWTAGTPRPGRAARPISAASAEGRTVCHPKGRSAAKDARSALTRRPARSYSAPTIPATVRYARRRSGERHERSIPRPPALPAPLADPPIAPQPTHTRLRRAHLRRGRGPPECSRRRSQGPGRPRWSECSRRRSQGPGRPRWSERHQ